MATLSVGFDRRAEDVGPEMSWSALVASDQAELEIELSFAKLQLNAAKQQPETPETERAMRELSRKVGDLEGALTLARETSSSLFR